MKEQKPKVQISTAMGTLLQHRDNITLKDLWNLVTKSLPVSVTIPVIFSYLTVGTMGFALGHHFTNDVEVSAVTPETPAVVEIEGALIGTDGKLYDNSGFMISVVENQYGPFNGNFRFPTQQKDKYSIWVTPELGSYPAKFWSNTPVSETDDGKFELVLNGYPTDLGIVEGSVNDPDSLLLGGEVIIDGIAGKVLSPEDGEWNDHVHGVFRVSRIPFGYKNVVAKDKNGNEIDLADNKIQIQMEGITPINLQVEE